jgi:hypothetical protein
VGAVLWVCQSSSSYQACIANQTSARHEESKENPPVFFFTLADNAAVYARCAGHVIYEYRDAVTAVATVFIALFTYTLFAATKGLVQAAQIQSDDMKRSVAAAKAAADASLLALRPWVSCEVKIVGDLTYRDNGDPCITLQFILKNVGHSPAMGVSLHFWFHLLSPVHMHSILIQQRMADLFNGLPPGDRGLLLFPGDIDTRRVNLNISSRAEIEALRT